MVFYSLVSALATFIYLYVWDLDALLKSISSLWMPLATIDECDEESEYETSDQESESDCDQSYDVAVEAESLDSPDSESIADRVKQAERAKLIVNQRNGCNCCSRWEQLKTVE